MLGLLSQMYVSSGVCAKATEKQHTLHKVDKTIVVVNFMVMVVVDGEWYCEKSENPSKCMDDSVQQKMRCVVVSSDIFRVHSWATCHMSVWW